MATHRLEHYMEDHFDQEELAEIPFIRNAPDKRDRARSKPQPVKPKAKPEHQLGALVQQADDQGRFDFSYHASRHERQWIIDSLGGYYESQWIDDVLRLLKGGKEANVYQCAANPSVPGGETYLAAKVYRPRMFRNLKNDHLYREGRANLDENGHIIVDDRQNHAMHKRTGYGLQLLHGSWIEHEYKTMEILHAAGVDTPIPLTRNNNAILMSYIGGDETPAPTLHQVSLSRREAERLFERVYNNLDRMLAHQRVHADLSAYNILYWEGEITLIDFPQAINPEENRSAYLIFQRDVRRVCEYFAHQGVQRNPDQIAMKLWKSHGLRIKPDIHPSLLDEQDPRDRALWRKLARE